MRYWYQKKINLITLALLPLSWAFGLIVSTRRYLYRCGIKKSQQSTIPVIIVGNITVGGTGKTPVVIWLAQLLTAQGYKPGIASRGYGGNAHYTPIIVSQQAQAQDISDEAILIASNTLCPTVVCIDRYAAVQQLQQLGCNIIICDDGLQYYRLQRQLEIAVIDGWRYFGNQLLLPAGPLREPISRLATVDFILINDRQPANYPASLKQLPSFAVQLTMCHFIAISNSKQTLPLVAFAKQTVHAIAGIGNPERFFHSLRQLGISIIPHVFPDHYLYQEQDLIFADDLAIIMTEKDAVKCRDYQVPRLWYVKVELVVTADLQQKLLTVIQNLAN